MQKVYFVSYTAFPSWDGAMSYLQSSRQVAGDWRVAVSWQLQCYDVSRSCTDKLRGAKIRRYPISDR